MKMALPGPSAATEGFDKVAFNNRGFIYLGVGTEDPGVDRAVIEPGGLRTTVVAVPERSAAVRVAVELVEGAAQSVELCGAFGAATVARVIEATGGRVPVGAVAYGMVSVAGLTQALRTGRGGSLTGEAPRYAPDRRPLPGRANSAMSRRPPNATEKGDS